MLYRKLGRTDLDVSIISLGCEYVWTASEKEVTDLVHASLNAGMNYIDIFIGTPSTREYFGRALKGRRDKVYIAGHLGCADIDGQYVKTRDEALCKRFINEFYEKLDTDYIDVLFLHNCDTLADLDEIMNGWMYDYAKSLQASGKAGYIGFSSHNTQVAIQAVKTGKIDVLMFPVNPLFNMLPQDSAHARMTGREQQRLTQEEKAVYPTKQELYDLCDEMNVAIIAMKPFAGGNILKCHEGGRIKGLLNLTPVQALSYALSIPQVVCAVPGFKDVNELEQSLKYLTSTPEERDFSEIGDSLLGKFSDHCMYCNHCQPCVQRIDIAEVTKLADMAQQEMTDDLKTRYFELEKNASDCIQCGACTARCPFNIDAAANMQRAQSVFKKVGERKNDL